MAEGNRNQDSRSGNPPGKDDSSSTDNKGKQNDSSIASRIQDSASGLARSAFFAPGPPQDLAHSLASGGKPGPSSSASFERPSSQAVADQYRQSSASSSIQGQGAGTPLETFRSSASAQQGRFGQPPFSEEEFQHTYDGNTDHGFLADTGIGKGKGKAGGSEFISPDDSQIPSDFDVAWQRGSHDALHNATSQHSSDGAAVVSLLADRSFDPEFPISAHEPAEPVDTELSPQPLTPEEIQMIETFRRKLPPPEQSQPSRINPASLIPDIDTFLNGITPGPGTDAMALRDDVLTNLPGAADWIGVEERYHDEVWGYLRPTLEAAAKEMEDNKHSQKAEDGPAVRRLKLVLKHMQG